MENYSQLGESRKDFADMRDVGTYGPLWNVGRGTSGFFGGIYTRCTGSDGQGYDLPVSVTPNVLPDVADAAARDNLTGLEHGDVVTLISNGQAYWWDTRTVLDGTAANPDAITWVPFGSGVVGLIPPNAELDPTTGVSSWIDAASANDTGIVKEWLTGNDNKAVYAIIATAGDPVRIDLNIKNALASKSADPKIVATAVNWVLADNMGLHYFIQEVADLGYYNAADNPNMTMRYLDGLYSPNVNGNQTLPPSGSTDANWTNITPASPAASTLFRGAFHSSNETGGIVAGDLMSVGNNVNVSATAVNNSTGSWTVTLDTALPSTDYVVTAGVCRAFDTSEPPGQVFAYLASSTTVEISIYTGNGGASTNRDFYIECLP